MSLSRRDFLKKAAVAGAGLAVAGCAPPATVVVEKEVQKVVKETVVVEKEVEKVVTATPVVPAAEAAKVRYWLWMDEPDHPSFPAMIDAFNQSHPDIQVEADILPWNQYFAKLTAAIGAGDAPDVAHSHPAWQATMWEWDVYRELDDWVNQWAGKDEVLDSAWAFGEAAPGKPLTGIPSTSLVYYTYVRTDLFEEMGLEYPTTHDEFLEVCKEFTNPDEDRYGYSMRGSRGGHYAWLCFFMERGGKIFDDEGNVVINSPGAVEANQWYMDLFTKHKVVQPSALSDGWKQNLSDLTSGRVAMMVHGVHTAPMVEEALGDKSSAIPMPKDQISWTRTLARLDAIPKQSKSPEAGFEFLAWRLDPENYHYTIEWQKGMPVLKSIADDPAYTENRFFKAALDQKASWGTEPNWHPYWAEFGEVAWHTNFQRACLGEITSQEMMDSFAEGFESNPPQR